MKCLKNLSVLQLVKMTQRFDLNPQYKNPRKRKAALIRSLCNYWKTNSIGECSICWEQIQPNKLCVTPCAHLFCLECLIPYIRHSEICPLCRSECSYTYIINRLFRKPEFARFLKRLINVSRQEEWTEEEDPVIYHVNIYIIMQNNLEFLYSFVTIFFAYYLLFTPILNQYSQMNGLVTLCVFNEKRCKGLQVFNLYINIITIFWVIYYTLS